ncbi:hypothetical protein [Neobacillus niacini]|uniref:hypothetical protein n=1 Tax=Neobacillus niacini TaxID=86668 RepID=UPI003983A0E5
MKKVFININFLLCILLLFNPAAISAEDNQLILNMEELSIKVMPEFAFHPNDKEKEHPPLLIGYQGTMRNQTDQPQKGQIEIPLPLNDKNFRIGYVADYSSDLSKVYEIEYILDQEKGTISWTTSEEIQPNDVYKFVVEFYTDTLKVDKERKSLSYPFKSFTDIGLFNVSFIEPLRAEKFVLNPAPEEKNTHGDEEGVHSYYFQGIKAGEEKNFTLTYERTETTPTVEMIEKQEQQPLNNNENKKNPRILSIAAVSGAGLLAAGAFVFLINRNRPKI